MLYIPKRVDPDHQLVRMIGWADANRLVREFGGMILHPANCGHLAREFRNREVIRLRAGGAHIADIAMCVGLTDRQVRNILTAAETAPEEMTPLNDNLPGTEFAMGQAMGATN